MAEEKKDKFVVDSVKVNVRAVAGVDVQTIPKRWRDRRDLKGFWTSKLIMKLVRVNGKLHIEIGLETEEEQ